MIKMTVENDKFLSLYRTYEGLLRSRGSDYRKEETEAVDGRMTIMRQMRNYLSHAEDPEFITISPLCIKTLEQMIKEEKQKGDIIKNHLVTPAKGSVKEGDMLVDVICKLLKQLPDGIYEIPVYDTDKRLKGLFGVEKAAKVLKAKGNIPLDSSTCGPYRKDIHLMSPNDPVPETKDGLYCCCTKDGTWKGLYMGYLDK